MTTYNQRAQRPSQEAHRNLQRNRHLWRDAERELLRAEAALQEFDADVVREAHEMLADLPASRDGLLAARDEALRRVRELDQAYVAELAAAVE